ncbi:hypothetical protein BN1318_430012 [Staphylococcus capitis]|nr:hypothetical protein BN1318_430012 [Staphylococcus capitis]
MPFNKVAEGEGFEPTRAKKLLPITNDWPLKPDLSIPPKSEH